MNGERVGDIVLHGNDAIRFAYMLYHPTEEELLYNRSVLERMIIILQSRKEIMGMMRKLRIWI